jgi:hypothetical protein
MPKEPTISEFLEAEEDELYCAIESDDYELSRSILTPEWRAKLQQAARNTLNYERIQLSLRAST